MKLLVIPNDQIRDFRRTTPKDFLDEMNPGRVFDEVRFLGWEEDSVDEFAGVKSYPFLSDKNKSKTNDLLQKLKSGEIPFSYPLFRPIFLNDLEAIKSFLKDYNLDLIRTFNTHFASELGEIAREITGKPLVISAYDPSRVTSVVRSADSLVCESHELKGICSSKYGVSTEKIQVIHNGIDPDVFYPRSSEEIAQVIPQQFLNSPYKILSVSRIVRGKNIETLLEAIALIKNELPGLVHIHLGSGDQKKVEEVKKLRKDLDLETSCYFFEARPKIETPAFYSWADAFVLPTLWEGLSRVMRESLACGTPAVVTNYGSSTEIVQNGYNGLLINPNDPKSIAKNLTTILTNRELRTKLSLNARPSMTRYNTTNSVRMHEENYKNLLGIK